MNLSHCGALIVMSYKLSIFRYTLARDAHIEQLHSLRVKRLVLTKRHRQRSWAIGLALLCVLQWFGVATHAFAIDTAITATLNAEHQHADKTSAQASHCHSMPMNSVMIDSVIPVFDHDNQSTQHPCCDDGCPMIDCHLLSAMVAPSKVSLPVPVLYYALSEAARSAHFSTTPPDRPPAA